MEKFRSKRDLSLVLFLSLVFGSVLIRAIIDSVWILVIIMLLVIAFVVHLFWTTVYSIEEGKLIVKSGFLIRISIEVHSIKRISESYNIMSSPALSFDRLEIVYNTFDTVLISPKEKERFIEAIKKINPQVEIKLKNEIRIKEY